MVGDGDGKGGYSGGDSDGVSSSSGGLIVTVTNTMLILCVEKKGHSTLHCSTQC